MERLIALADILAGADSLSTSDRLFLSDFLRKVANGEPPHQALGLKKNPGRPPDDNTLHMKQFALSWLATANAPIEDGGLGLSLEEARGLIGEHDLNAFGFTEETLKTYWKKNKPLRERTFKLKSRD